MHNYENKFWVEDICSLFTNVQLVPLDGMTLYEQFNAITRIVIIVFMILSLFGYENSTLFLLFSLLFITIIYYIQQNIIKMVTTENYKHSDRNPKTHFGDLNILRTSVYDQNNTIADIEPERNNMSYRDDSRKIITAHNMLSGKPNPKTDIAPVIAQPSHNLDHWKATNLISHSAINTESNHNLTQSGYIVTNSSNKNYKRPNNIQANSIPHGSSYELPFLREAYSSEKCETVINEGDYVNKSCGYNSQNLEHYGLPSNYPITDYDKNSYNKTYNENLFTNTIQPGVYTRNEIIEPINSNIGISFIQPKQYVTSDIDNNTGDIYYTEHDPSSYTHPPTQDQYFDDNLTNVYDPRFTGYGASNRSYIDEVTGQPRFNYNDVDSVRMHNDISRSNIDVNSSLCTRNPFQTQICHEDEYTTNREMVHNNFLNSALQHRTDLQHSLMRKSNARAWQQRQAPIHTNSR